jgi:23S rRNA pseudouridine1911/1915/1917 synthase
VSELRVLGLDNHLLVVDKPAGVPTVPDESGDDSLLDQGRRFLAREFQKPGRVFLGVVQRLDRPVSGALCFARTSKAAARLTQQLKDHRLAKHYWALCGPWRAAEQGTLVQWLHKDERSNRVTAFDAERPGCQRAETRYRVRARLAGGLTWLELEPVTGRSHQLRVACASLGAPLLGDLKYGAREPLPDQSVALHARTLSLDHPTRGERLTFEAEPPRGGPWSALPRESRCLG